MARNLLQRQAISSQQQFIQPSRPMKLFALTASLVAVAGYSLPLRAAATQRHCAIGSYAPLRDAHRNRSSAAVMCAEDRADHMEAGCGTSNQPSVEMRPTDVVERQLDALKKGDFQACFGFVSPDNQRTTGPWQNFELLVRKTPSFAPLVDYKRYSIIGAIPVGSDRYQCRVRVWPAHGVTIAVTLPERIVRVKAPVLDYDWTLSRQSDSSIDYTIAGCWLVDEVTPDAAPLEAWRKCADHQCESDE